MSIKSTITTAAAEASTEVKDPSKRKYPSSPNGNHRPHPRPHRRPDDPNALHPPPAYRRRDTSKPSDRDRERHRERRERPPGERPSGEQSSRRPPRPRSNSESSIPSDRSHRRKDEGHIHKPKSRRDKDYKTSDKKSTTSNGKRQHPVDKIDLLDVTGLYGSHGCIRHFWLHVLILVFHHDGPFDACRPHRNKQPHKAPVAAFPADSLTNTLAGGLGEVPGLDRDKYFGLRPQEAFEDYGHIAPAGQRRTSDPATPSVQYRQEDNESNKIRPSVGFRSTAFDPRLKTEPVHGVESAGLGTSTFLEGAPAPKSAIEKANAAAMVEDEDGSGIARKKSLVQKIKSGRRGTTSGDRSPAPPPPIMNGPLLTSTGTTATNIDPAYNPFLKEGQFIERVESLPASRERADSGGSDKGGVSTSGLLGRVKSLKISGGRNKGRRGEE